MQCAYAKVCRIELHLFCRLEIAHMTIQSFIPPERTLMGPGPSDVSARVLTALGRPTIGHLDPMFIGMMDELKSLLQYAFQTTNPYTIALSAPGSAGMEACFVNLVAPGDTVVVCRNGVFGQRMVENVERFKMAVVNAARAAKSNGFGGNDDFIVVTAGVPFNTPGTTNILRVAPCDERLIIPADPE